MPQSKSNPQIKGHPFRVGLEIRVLKPAKLETNILWPFTVKPTCPDCAKGLTCVFLLEGFDLHLFWYQLSHILLLVCEDPISASVQFICLYRLLLPLKGLWDTATKKKNLELWNLQCNFAFINLAWKGRFSSSMIFFKAKKFIYDFHGIKKFAVFFNFSLITQLY